MPCGVRLVLTASVLERSRDLGRSFRVQERQPSRAVGGGTERVGSMMTRLNGMVVTSAYFVLDDGD